MSGMMDATLAFFTKGLKLRSCELKQDVALVEAAKLGHFFAVELNYKGTPIRLIVAASSVPDGLALVSRDPTRELSAPDPPAAREENPDASKTLFDHPQL